MTPEKQRIAIAETCGYVCVPDKFYTDRIAFEKDCERFASCDIPDYLNDLNAMHEAEEHLHGEDWARYFESLQRKGKATGVRATAAQRAEAFLRTIGKWEGLITCQPT